MEHQQKEKYDRLQYLLTLNTKRVKQEPDNRALEADFLWDASRFWANVLYLSKLSGKYKTKADLEAFAANYKYQTGIRIDVAAMFQKFWLREVLGFIYIARSIRSAFHGFKELEGYKEELKFINEFHHKHDNRKFEVTVSEEFLEAAILAYEQEHQIILDRGKIISNRWCKQKNGNVAFSSIDIYYAPYLQYWEEFCFLTAWYDAIVADSEHLFITRENFDLARKSFSHLEDFPALDIFRQQKVIKDKGEYYTVAFYNIEVNYWYDLQDKITGYYWEMLFRDKVIPDPGTKVKLWLTKALYGANWPNHLAHVTEAAGKAFLDAAVGLVTESEDIAGTENEFAKILLDGKENNGISVLSVAAQRQAFDTTLRNGDLFELLASLDLLEEQARLTFLYDQPARKHLCFLIRTIVLQDPEWDGNQNAQSPAHRRRYRRINQLLEQSLSKPYILWDVTRFIIMERKELVPPLLIEPTTATLALFLVDEIESETTLPENILLEIWKLATELALECLIDTPIKNDLVGNAIFQLYWLISQRAFGQQNRRQKHTADFYRTRNQTVIETIENCPLKLTYYKREDTAYLLPVIFPALVEVFLNYQEVPFYNNGTIQLPLLKWNGLFWLLKIASTWKYQKQLTSTQKEIRKISSQFFQEYLDSMEGQEIKVYNYFEKKDELKCPLWSEKMYRLQLVDWRYAIYQLHETGQLGHFLSPRFQFDAVVLESADEEQQEAKNTFNANKLRTHIGVLLQVLKQFATWETTHVFNAGKVASIKNSIEKQVDDFLRAYNREAPEDGNVDILHYNLEWRFQSSDNEALLPQLAKAINWFTDKKPIIETVTETSDIVRLLILLGYTTSEGTKKAIIDRIQISRIIDYLQASNWIPQIQTVMTKLSGYLEFLPHLTETVKFWEEKVINRRSDKTYNERLYQARLLIAYYNKDEAALQAVPVPGEFYGSRSDFSYQAYKDFYRGLLLMKSEPGEGHRIFSDLANQYPDYLLLGLNKLAAKVEIATKNKDNALFVEALEEWNYLANNPYKGKDLKVIEPDLTANLMEIHLALNEYQAVDSLFSALTLPDQMQPSILSLKIDSLLSQNKVDEATILFESAKGYHDPTDTSVVTFIQDLEEKLGNRDTIIELRNQYARIFRNTPRRLVRILPDTFNEKEDLHEFLVQEIIRACSKLLIKINSINQISNEDKYNDLVEALLDARLNFLGWHVGEQSRGGFPGGDKLTGKAQPGERDLPVFDGNKRCLMICEALIYRGKTTAVSHLTKLFNYEHQRQAFTILFYDDGSTKKDFDTNWNDYIQNILSATPFPAGYEIVGPIDGVTDDFDCTNSGIKVGKSLHGSKTVIYHVFVNINYRV